MARVPYVRRTNPVSTEAAIPAPSGLGFAALTELSRIGSDFIKPAAERQATEEGFNAVYRDENGKLQISEKNVLGGEMADIHNAAAYSKFLAQRKIDITENLTELAQKHQFDPAGFRTAADGYLKLLQSEDDVPEVLKQDILLSAETEIARRFNGLYASETQRTYQQSNTETKTYLDMRADDYVSLVMAGDEKAAAEVYAEMEQLANFRATAPYITDTAATSEAYLRGVRGTAQAAALTRRLADTAGLDDIPVDLKSDLEAALRNPDLSPLQRERLYSATQGRLKGIDATGIANRLGDSSYEAMLVRAESGGKADAKSASSSATGLHQFTDVTWLSLVREFRPEWSQGLSDAEILELRKDPAKSSEMFQHFRDGNRVGLELAGIAVTPGNEYAAHFLGISRAVDVLSADPSALVSELVPAGVIEANPFLKDMTVTDFRNWAARKMTMKSSDLSAQMSVIDQIPDEEVRGMAATILSDQIASRRREEGLARDEYTQRLDTDDDTLTEQEIFEDHRLSDNDQASLIDSLRTARAAEAKVGNTVARLAAGDSFNVYDSKERTAVNEAYSSLLGDAEPMSPEGMVLAGDIANQSGLLPKRFFDGVRTAINAGDPAAVASSLGFMSQVLDRQPNAIGPYDGGSEITNALADFSFFSQYMPAEEAAARLVEMRSPEERAKRKNLSDQAKEVSKKATPDDFITFLSDRGVSAEIGQAEPALMADYTRLIEEAFLDTNDAATAMNRANHQLARIWGTNEVTGSSGLMKYPPQNFYPARAENPNWMRDQIEDAVSLEVFGEGFSPSSTTGLGRVGQRAAGSVGVGDVQRVFASNIVLISDEQTRKQVNAGIAPSYRVQYFDGDGMLQAMPRRFYFDAPPAPENTNAADFEKARQQLIDNPLGLPTRMTPAPGPFASQDRWMDWFLENRGQLESLHGGN